jgi:LAS superfamily LD-carboxypeptidase LdcB
MGSGRVPGPLGAGGATVNSPAPLGASERLNLAGFKRAVIDLQIAHLLRKGRHFFARLPDSALEVVEGNHRMCKPAAGQCRALLAAAREALATAQAAGDERARKTTNIVVHSAYRDFDTDTAAWEGTFRKHYKKMLSENAVPGDALGPAALQYMVHKLIPLKAPPGYSNHSNGAAVDFGTTFDGVYYKADSSTRAAWRKTWLHPWLIEHAAEFGFKALKTEEWHWDYAQA